MKTNGALLLASLLAGLSGSVSGQLAPQVDQNQLDRANPAQEIRQNPQQANVRVNERQAVALARQQFEGNVLRISLTGERPNRRYQIRMENEGKVFTVFVHATTGQVTGGN